MGSAKSGNRKARGRIGHKGGTGRPPKNPEDKRSKHILMSPRLWDLLNVATMEACEDDWHTFLEKVFEGRVTIACSRPGRAGEANWLLNNKACLRPPFPAAEAGRSAA